MICSPDATTSAQNSTSHYYGPYVKKIPPLPLGSRKGATGVFITSDPSASPQAGPATDGWWYNTTMHVFRANLPDEERDDRGTSYNDYGTPEDPGAGGTGAETPAA